MKKRNLNGKILLFLGCFLITLGILFLFFPCVINRIEDQEEEKKIKEFFESENNNLIVFDGVIAEEENTSKEYKMVLEIPSIGLKKGLYDINSLYNNIEYNIEIEKKSDMPDINKGNFILLAHNGNSKVSFFENLKKMKIGDEINIYYKSKKYIYKLDSSYDVNKNGSVELRRNEEKNTITMITCKNGSKTMQTVYVGYLSTEM